MKGERETKERMEVIARRLAYEEDPKAFAAQWEEEERALTAQIMQARERLKQVGYPKKILEKAAQIGIELEIDGHRADICMVNAARTICAWEGRTEIQLADLERGAAFALPHRMHRRPFEEADFQPEQIRRILYGE